MRGALSFGNFFADAAETVKNLNAAAGLAVVDAALLNAVKAQVSTAASGGCRAEFVQ